MSFSLKSKIILFQTENEIILINFFRDFFYLFDLKIIRYLDWKQDKKN